MGNEGALDENWADYLRGLAVGAAAAPGTETAVAATEAWARQGKWASGLFTTEPSRVLVLAGADDPSGLSRAVAGRLAGMALGGRPGIPVPIHLTVDGPGNGAADAHGMLARQLGAAGLSLGDWRIFAAPSLAVIDGLDALVPARPGLPSREGRELLEELCSHHFAASRVVLATSRLADDSRNWELITDRLDRYRRIKVLNVGAKKSN